MNTKAKGLRTQILDLVAKYYELNFTPDDFIPGKTNVPISGRVFDAAELQYLVDSSLDFWLTTGRFANQFEKKFSRLFGLRHAILTNSGSSANLLALSCLTSPSLGEKRLLPGDEIITVAAGFPTTINPIIQNRLTPVFVDITLPTYNIDVSQLESALSKRTRAVILAHTLGNPFDLSSVMDFARQHNLWMIEDCCDALGSTYRGRQVGAFGDLATMSFYPAHHITMGEGGCVLTNQTFLKKLVTSFRDWGRDCWCETGEDNTCGCRFDWQLGSLPYGYDHKYTYSHIGYNLKITDMQAAVGLAQLTKLPHFIKARKQNFTLLYKGLKDLEEFFIMPQATPGSDPSWFGFPLALRPGTSLTRDQVIRFLEAHKISTRPLFGGNLIRQPAYQNICCRIVGDLRYSDFVANHAFWVGVYPGLSIDQINYVIEIFHELIKTKKDSQKLQPLELGGLKGARL